MFYAAKLPGCLCVFPVGQCGKYNVLSVYHFHCLYRCIYLNQHISMHQLSPDKKMFDLNHDSIHSKLHYVIGNCPFEPIWLWSQYRIALVSSSDLRVYKVLFEKCQNAQTTDLFPPLCIKFSCRATVHLQKFALIGEKISRPWASRQFSNRA